MQEPEQHEYGSPQTSPSLRHWQLPCWQLSVQQSSSSEQLWPVLVQEVFATQTPYAGEQNWPLQHPFVLKAQGAAAGKHATFPQTPRVVLHPSGLQHSDDDRHAAPFGLHVTLVHEPDLQEPLQHSSSAAQVKPSGWQIKSLHVPLTRHCFVQHCSSTEHASPAAKQAVPPQVPPTQASLQQSTELVQAAPEAPQQDWRKQTERPPVKPQHCSSVEQLSRAARQTGATSRHFQALWQLSRQPFAENCSR